VYYGQDAGGPYPSRIEKPDDGADPQQVTIPGLAPATEYCVIVVPEDEARNVSPFDFDPAVHRTDAPPNAACETTLDCGGGCPPFGFGGPTAAIAGECQVDVSWEAASGVDPIEYEVLRDGSPVVSGLTGTAWTDTGVAWGSSYTYQVRARDACWEGARQGLNDVSAAVSPADTTAPTVARPTLLSPGGCSVSVDSLVTDTCSGPAATVDVLRQSVVIATGVTLPYLDTVPADGSYAYEVRGYDLAGNSALSGPNSIDVSGCGGGGPCLHRKTCAAQDITGVFMARDLVTDVAFTEPERSTPYGPCPFVSGWPDPEPVLEPGRPPLIFYQLEGAGARIFLEKLIAGRTVRITTF